VLSEKRVSRTHAQEDVGGGGECRLNAGWTPLYQRQPLLSQASSFRGCTPCGGSSSLSSSSPTLQVGGGRCLASQRLASQRLELSTPLVPPHACNYSASMGANPFVFPNNTIILSQPFEIQRHTLLLRHCHPGCVVRARVLGRKPCRSLPSRPLCIRGRAVHVGEGFSPVSEARHANRG
jgi:hypothetical protein